MITNKEEIIRAYESKIVIYNSLKDNLERLLKDILVDHSRGIHSITARVKGKDSFVGKLERKSYNSIENITDIVGVRIISYFEDEVKSIGEVLSNEFKIDIENSVDKSSQLKDTEFGYKSLHFVMEMSEKRCSFAEYSRFSKIKFEVQIRSILQHAWAEIEHDIGYKSEKEAPPEIRRRFSLLAGLLELADEEFTNIKNKRSTYRKVVEASINDTNSLKLIDINTESLKVFANSAYMNSLSAKIAETTSHTLYPSNNGFAATYSAYLYLLEVNKIFTIEELKNYVSTNEKEIIKLADEFLDRDEPRVLPSDIGMFYTAFYLVASKKDYNMFEEYASRGHIDGGYGSTVFYNELLEAFKRAEIRRV